MRIKSKLIKLIERKNTMDKKSNTIYASRTQFPILAAPAKTIHKGQGETEEEIIFNYDENMNQDLINESACQDLHQLRDFLW